MQENRNSASSFSCDGKGTVCIDTTRVLDGCRDRDCFEDVRVYLSDFGEEIISNATNVRTRCAKLVWAYVGVDEVPFNRGFFKITVRYFVEIEFEACLGIGRSQTFKGIAVTEKEVVLYGGEGRVLSFASGINTDACSIGTTAIGSNDPKAIVEVVEPIVLNTKIAECGCHNPCCDLCDFPDTVRCCLDGEIVTANNGPRLLVSLGIFSVIRIVRPIQILVQATDYTVPDKECACGNDDNPCALFRTIAFPVSEFRGVSCCNEQPANTTHTRSSGCGCKDK